ncbi:SDR family NAD(P)-dependent oxidoreductase [Rhizobium sp. BT-226]|uniref:SDR family NAD(P)-dependent oxidoreductase n=1 Tax=Rhizobium sp. BT-226 TaxID=2986922 RepID=UPI0021F7FC69|nr:SDR family NAD(P)-dependent oxidoreductase [Rhizobium sp. BT-226]MCW0021307.1 SDR family NAD(P)-dependent oxidoreductase [Rhizobium sp. BT-226]
MAKSLIVFRHAQTRFNPIEGRDENGDTTFVAQGRGIDPPIDECGVKQALAGGFALRHEDIRHVICSPSQRAVQTAIYAKIVNNAEFTLHSELQEHDFLEHEGKMLPGKAFRGPYPGIEDPVEFTEKFIIPGLGLVHNEKTVVVTHGGWFKGGAGVLGMKLSAEDVGNAVPVRLEDDGSGWKATRLRAILHLALCQVQETADVENAGFEEGSNEGLEQILEHYGLSLSLLKPRALVLGEDMSAIAEMRHGPTQHFDLHLFTGPGKEDIPWRKIIENIVERVLIAKPGIGAVRLLIPTRKHYSDPNGPDAILLRRVLDEFVRIGEAWNIDFDDATIHQIDEMILSKRIRDKLVLPRGISTTSDNRVVLISGPTRGIGLEIAKALILEGYLVSLGARDLGRLTSLFGDETERIHYAQFDAEDEGTWETWISAAVAKFGRIDGLVNNAGCGAGGKVNLMDGNDEGLDKLLTIHAKAPSHLVRLCMPYLRTTGAGRVVFINSLSAKRVLGSKNLGYNVAKAAQQGLAHTANNEAWDEGVRVTSVCPGWVHTDLSAHSKVPIEDKTQPQTVGAIVAFLMGLPNNAELGDITVNCEHEAKR